MKPYGYRWEKHYRLSHLRKEPLCRFCLAAGGIVPARVVDHIRGHEGEHDPEFWNPDNYQSLCFYCHDSVKQQLEKSGRARGCDADGYPLHPRKFDRDYAALRGEDK